jgi:hypothetical protein
MTFEGACNRDLFEMWLGECLIPQLTPGDVIVIDNAKRWEEFENFRDCVDSAFKNCPNVYP